MAECSEQDMAQVQTSNGTTDDFVNFCKNFTFLDTSTCCHCNGFYGPNHEQPLCVSCHKFLISNRKRKRSMTDRASFRSYHDSSSNLTWEQASSSRSHPLLKDYLSTFFDAAEENDENDERRKKKKIEEQTDGATDHDESSSSANSSMSVPPVVQSDTHISELPVEMLLKIFSYSNEKTLLTASKVCEQWKEILDTQQEMWKNYVKKLWPILDTTTATGFSWLKLCTALESSCCCRICVDEITKKSNCRVLVNNSQNLRRQAERERVALFNVDGMIAVPIDRTLKRWQASIPGPPDSPYEGGIFFLIIDLPNSYPFEPPMVKFLTKIIHPNISRHGDIGLDVLTWKYSLCLTIMPILLSIQSLLCDPFTSVCMEPELGRLYDLDRPRFDALARHWTRKFAIIDEISVK